MIVKQQHWQDWATLALGLWLVVSPWTIAHGMAGPRNPLGVPESAMWDIHVLGILITILALMVLSTYARWMEWVSVVLGASLFVSPWLFGFTGSEGLTWNALIVGALIAAFAGGSLARGQRSARVAK